MSDIKNQALYYIIFEDNSKFYGGNIHNTKWLKIPNKKIKRLFYNLPDGNCLCFDKYEKYFHMIEAVKDLNGKNRGKQIIEYAYIMGKRNNTVVSYRITLFNKPNNKYKIGDIVRREFDVNDRKITGLNPEGWK